MTKETFIKISNEFNNKRFSVRIYSNGQNPLFSKMSTLYYIKTSNSAGRRLTCNPDLCCCFRSYDLSDGC